MRARLGRLMALLFPWPARTQRVQAIADATAQRERSQAGAVRDTAIGRDIERLAAMNHIAARIAEQITGKRGDT